MYDDFCGNSTCKVCGKDCAWQNALEKLISACKNDAYGAGVTYVCLASQYDVTEARKALEMADQAKGDKHE